MGLNKKGFHGFVFSQSQREKSWKMRKFSERAEKGNKGDRK